MKYSEYENLLLSFPCPMKLILVHSYAYHRSSSIIFHQNSYCSVPLSSLCKCKDGLPRTKRTRALFTRKRDVVTRAGCTIYTLRICADVQLCSELSLFRSISVLYVHTYPVFLSRDTTSTPHCRCGYASSCIGPRWLCKRCSQRQRGRREGGCILDVASLINYRCTPSATVTTEVHRPPRYYHGTDGTVSDELRDRRRQTRRLSIYLSSLFRSSFLIQSLSRASTSPSSPSSPFDLIYRLRRIHSRQRRSGITTGDGFTNANVSQSRGIARRFRDLRRSFPTR